MDPRIQILEKEVELLKERNVRVEAGKAWEVSLTRRFFIAVSTYIVASIWLILIDDSFPLLKAFVPAVGYLLSTLSLPFVKKWWMKNQTQK